MSKEHLGCNISMLYTVQSKFLESKNALYWEKLGYIQPVGLV